MWNPYGDKRTGRMMIAAVILVCLILTAVIFSFVVLQKRHEEAISAAADTEGQTEVILNYLNERYNIKLKVNKSEIFNVLKEKNTSKANKKDMLINCFNFDKTEKQIITNMINSFLGYTFDLNKIFEIELEKNKISFSSEIENEEDIKESLQENSIIYESMNEIYSWFILQDILKGKKYISEAMIAEHKKYKNDLILIKKTYKE